MTWLRKNWLIVLAGAIALAALSRAACVETQRFSSAPVEVHRELAQERVADHQAEGKATRRAARARVDKEVSDAVSTSSLADYLRSR